MRKRCLNPRSHDFQDYGGRGITIDPAWNDFMVFLEDVGPKPSSKHSLGRIDNDGPYRKSNVEWQDPVTQARNKRNTLLLMSEGVKKTLIEIAEELGMPYGTAKSQFHRGETVSAANPKQKYSVVYHGTTMPLHQAANLAGLRYHLALYRFHRGRFP
jgi:hypothetical protein